MGREVVGGHVCFFLCGFALGSVAPGSTTLSLDGVSLKHCFSCKLRTFFNFFSIPRRFWPLWTIFVIAVSKN